MKLKNMRKRIALTAAMFAMLLLNICVPVSSYASDVAINPASSVFLLPTLTWGGSGPGTFNNNFWFTPLSPSESVCVYVYNNNPTSAHTFKTSINVSANPAEKTPSDGSWNQAAVWTNMVAPVSVGVASNISASVSGAALVSIDFSGATTQSGSPDTVNVVVTQTTGTCFSGQNTAQSANPEISFSPLQYYSSSLSSAFYVTSTPVTNPSATQITSYVNNNTSSKTQYFDHATLSASVATDFEIAIATTAGTCTNGASANLNIGSTITTTALASNTCSANPNLTNAIDISVPANSEVSVDLRGYIASAGTTNGLAILTRASVTGTVNTSLLWYEK